MIHLDAVPQIMDRTDLDRGGGMALSAAASR